jgi:hypothetical protein
MNGSIQDRFLEVQGRIAAAAERAGREPGEITLVTVTKNHPVPAIIQAVEAGARELGENRAAEAAEKFQTLGRDISDTIVKWHFIGYLQSNKAKTVVPFADLIHSVDRVELALEIDKRAKQAGKLQDILLEINVSGEASKAGAAVSEAAALAEYAAALKNIRPVGLMTMAPLGCSRDEAKRIFASLRELRDTLLAQGAAPALPHLSMGMTDDFEEAIVEGATMVRVGRAIMGG